MRRKRRNEETLPSAIFVWPSMTDVIAAAIFRHVTYHVTQSKLGMRNEAQYCPPTTDTCMWLDY